MPIYELDNAIPTIHEDAYVHPDAIIIGDVAIGANSSVWPTAVLRGDLSSISIGENTSIQDGAVIHTGENKPTIVGDNTIVGHLVHLEGCTIGNRCLIGVGASVRHNSVVEDEAIVGAHAMVKDGTLVPTGNRALGVPAKVAPGEVDLVEIDRIVNLYIENARRFRSNLKQIK